MTTAIEIIVCLKEFITNRSGLLKTELIINIFLNDYWRKYD